MATTRKRVGRSKKTTTKAMFYVRWDKAVYKDEDEGAMERLGVLAKNHGAYLFNSSRWLRPRIRNCRMCCRVRACVQRL